MPVAPFRGAAIEGVAAVLGETDEGLTNREIGAALAAANIPDPRVRAEQADPLVRAGYAYVKMSKVERIQTALAEHQQRSGTGSALVGLVHAAMGPQRYVDAENVFNVRRERLNAVLAFEGLEVQDDGRLHRRQPVRTLTEAARLADTLSAELRHRRTHPSVLKYCTAEVLAHNNFHASLEATKGVFDRIRQEVGVQGDGAALVDSVFGFKSCVPLLALNDLGSESQRGEQSGFMLLLKGLYAMYRNPVAHEAKIRREESRPVTDDELLELFTVLSMVHGRLDVSLARRLQSGPSLGAAEAKANS